MTLERLVALVPPPAGPVRAGPDAWSAVERTLGLSLPADFRAFVEAYGSGVLGRFFVVWNPLDLAAWTERLRRTCDAVRAWCDGEPERARIAVHPASPGFLPWGCDDNGNVYGWLTEGPPDAWPVLTLEVRGAGLTRHERSMTDYLADVLRGEREPLALDYPGSGDLCFEPLAGT